MTTAEIRLQTKPLPDTIRDPHDTMITMITITSDDAAGAERKTIIQGGSGPGVEVGVLVARKTKSEQKYCFSLLFTDEPQGVNGKNLKSAKLVKRKRNE